MRHWGTVAITLAWLSPPASSFAEEKTWVTERARYEEWLRTAEVLEVEDVGSGVTKPRKVTLKEGEVVFHAAYKPIKRGRHQGFWESYQAEVAAYRLDRILGLDMVPPTIERRVESDLGSLQFWVPDCHLYKEVEGKMAMTPDFSQQVSRMKMFDNLIYNSDRNAGNFLIDADKNVVLIDHSRAFVDRKDLLDKWLPAQFDRSLVERLKALDEATLEAELDDLLMGGQIESILARRDKLLKYMDKLIAEKGERAVFFN